MPSYFWYWNFYKILSDFLQQYSDKEKALYNKTPTFCNAGAS